VIEGGFLAMLRHYSREPDHIAGISKMVRDATKRPAGGTHRRVKWFHNKAGIEPRRYLAGLPDGEGGMHRQWGGGMSTRLM
jgi:hypothetical protein